MNASSFTRKTALALLLAASVPAANAATEPSTSLAVVATQSSSAAELRVTAPDIQRHSISYTAFAPDAVNTRLDEAAMGISYDQFLTSTTVAALSADPKLDGHITVFTANGVVSLSGKMRSVAMINRAIEVVRGVKGVKGVLNNGIAVS